MRANPVGFWDYIAHGAAAAAEPGRSRLIGHARYLYVAVRKETDRWCDLLCRQGACNGKRLR